MIRICSGSGLGVFVLMRGNQQNFGAFLYLIFPAFAASVLKRAECVAMRIRFWLGGSPSLKPISIYGQETVNEAWFSQLSFIWVL